jgi:cell division cycle 20, cofactor of APC complex
MTLSSDEDAVTSLSWSDQGTHLAVGTNYTDVQIWDAESLRQLRCMKGHMGRVSALAWNDHVLSSAGRDTSILNHDVRIENHNISTFRAHEQEVCGLKWSPDGSQLASGGNDNMLYIWDQAAQERPVHSMDQHQAAVKALAWCPWQRNVLASGGGTADRTIRMWNTTTGACLNSVDTKYALNLPCSPPALSRTALTFLLRCF